MIALREIMRECNSGILKRHQGEATLVPRLCAAVLTMLPLGPGTGAYDVNILIGGGEEILMIAKTSARIEYLLFAGRVEYRCWYGRMHSLITKTRYTKIH